MCLHFELTYSFTADTKGKTYQDFERDMDRDTFMSAEEALEYGLIDKIIDKR